MLIGGGKTFIAGADIKEFGKITSGKKTRDVGLYPTLTEIENCPKPVVCAIHGTAFGGGLEFAQACHYRVAAPNAQIGQPEVKLGIIPGAAGTQRLPRLAGVVHAAEMCAMGNPISAKQAHEWGIVDQLIEGDLLAGAVAFARAQAASGKPPRKVREISDRFGDPAANATALADLRKQAAKAVAGHAGPAASDRSRRSRGQPALRGRLQEGRRTLPAVPVRQRIEGDDPRLLRRADGRQNSRPAERRQADRDQVGRRRRRRARWGAASR